MQNSTASSTFSVSCTPSPSVNTPRSARTDAPILSHELRGTGARMRLRGAIAVAQNAMPARSDLN